MKWLLASLLMVAVAHAATPQLRLTSSRSMPRPEAQRAEVSTCGTISCLSGTLDIARVREPSPEALYCGDFIRPSEGFSWFCSRHYAVKTDLPESEATQVLELLELAWPQYRTIFGAAPPAPRRMALVVASSRNALKRAMIDDGMFAFTLGGVTQEGYGCSYLYAGTPYQTRYIVLHEATHLFQYCLSGNTRGSYGFFLEGVADYLSSHVFDPAAHRLEVNVLDRAPIHNHLADGLCKWRSLGEPSFTALYSNPDPSRGLAVLLTAFLQSTPDYAAKWREYCRRIVVRPGMGADGAKAASDALLDELYGGPTVLAAPFRKWVSSLSPSYSLLRRDFDQEGGNVFVSCEPASPDAPAELEWRGGAASAVAVCNGPFRLRWRETPEKGAFARIELFPANGAGEGVSCVISNAPLGRMAFFEVDGTRATDIGGRRLWPLLESGLEIRVEGGAVALLFGGAQLARLPVKSGFTGEAGRWRISASQPGVVFEMGDAVSDKGKFRDVVETAASASGAVKKDAEGVAILDWHLLGPFALLGGAFGRSGTDIPRSPVDMKAVHSLDDGTFSCWQPASLRVNAAFSAAPIANLTATFGRQANNSFAYAVANIESAGGDEVEISLGVSDGVEAFLNGEKVFDDVRRREWQEGNARFRATLRPGANELLLRLTHGCGVWLLSGNQRKVSTP